MNEEVIEKDKQVLAANGARSCSNFLAASATRLSGIGWVANRLQLRRFTEVPGVHSNSLHSRNLRSASRSGLERSYAMTPSQRSPMQVDGVIKREAIVVSATALTDSSTAESIDGERKDAYVSAMGEM